VASNFQLPIDFDAYCRLRNHIAKALVPLLQIWLYTSMRAGRFEKAYTDFCQLLNIRRYGHLSKITEVLRPSLDELTTAGYLASWAIEPRTKGEDFKICVTHGRKFYADREARARGGRDAGMSGDSIEDLVRRGIAEAVARQVLASVPDDQPIDDQLEWGDYLVQTSRAGTFRNPAGFYVYLLRNGILPPSEFETRRIRALRQARVASESQLALSRLELENEYSEYRLRAVEAAKQRDYSGERLAERIAELKDEIRAANPETGSWLPARLDALATQRLNAEILQRLSLPTFDEFLSKQQRQADLFEHPSR